MDSRIRTDEPEKNVTIIYILTDPPVLFGGSQNREKNEGKEEQNSPERDWL